MTERNCATSVRSGFGHRTCGRPPRRFWKIPACREKRSVSPIAASRSMMSSSFGLRHSDFLRTWVFRASTFIPPTVCRRIALGHLEGFRPFSLAHASGFHVTQATARNVTYRSAVQDRGIVAPLTSRGQPRPAGGYRSPQASPGPWFRSRNGRCRHRRGRRPRPDVNCECRFQTPGHG